MYKTIGFILSILALTTTARAQSSLFKDASDYAPFKHIEAGVKVGTMGIGVDIATPINKNINVRAGISFMPQITLTKGYKIATVGSVNEDNSPQAQEQRLKKLCGYLSDMIGDSLYKNVDEYVDMNHQVKFYNAHLLVDWYPFKKKNWHFTAGLYIGPKNVGKAINADWESATMVAINMYNNMYDQIQELEEGEYPSFNWGKYNFEMDPFSGDQMINAFNENGRATVKLGEFPDGTPHYVNPDRSAVMEAKAEQNSIKPYIGFGWQTNTGHDKRWTFGFNAGILYWGKTHIYCNDGVCLVHDVQNIDGRVGSLLKLLKNTPVYPNLELRLAYSLY